MEKSFYKDYFILERKHWLFKVRRKVFLYFIKKFRKSGLRILDFGCGSGYLMGELQKMGCDTHGVDFEKEAVDYGSEAGVSNLTLGTGSKINYPDSSFDMVTAFDILEHIKDEKPSLGELSRVLKPGGKMIISVPAYQWLWGVQDEVSHHFRRYTIKSLAKVIQGFPELNILRKTYYNTLLFPAIAAVRLLSRWFKLEGRKSDFEIDNKILSFLFYSIFNLETHLLKVLNFPFGVSILVVLEKAKNE